MLLRQALLSFESVGYGCISAARVRWPAAFEGLRLLRACGSARADVGIGPYGEAAATCAFAVGAAISRPLMPHCLSGWPK